MEINKITNLLNLDHVKFLISIFKENNIEIRLVGGCIRDALLEREIEDIDTATTLEPQDVLSLLKDNNIYFDKIGQTQKEFFELEKDLKISVKELYEINNRWYKEFNGLNN